MTVPETRRAALSLRFRITLILAAINVAIWSALAFYVVAEGRSVRKELADNAQRLRETTTDAVSSLLSRLIGVQVAEKVAEGRAHPSPAGCSGSSSRRSASGTRRSSDGTWTRPS